MLPRWLSFPLLALLLVVLGVEITVLLHRLRAPRENPYDPVIVAAAREYDVDPFLVRALIWRESQFKPETYGQAQEHGLMQVRPVVGQEWAKANKVPNFQEEDLFDPAINVRAGTWYLGRALRHWKQADDPVPFALAEYNAGRANALKWVDPANPQSHLAFLQRITFPSTRKYVEVILAKRAEYREALAQNRWYRDFPAGGDAMSAAP